MSQALKKIGTRQDVWDGLATRTSGGLIKSDLAVNARGKLVSKKKQAMGKLAFAQNLAGAGSGDKSTQTVESPVKAPEELGQSGLSHKAVAPPAKPRRKRKSKAVADT